MLNLVPFTRTWRKVAHRDRQLQFVSTPLQFEANIEARLWIGNTSDFFGSAMDSAKQTPQDKSGRLWDVVFMAAHAVRAQTGSGAQQDWGGMV